MVEVKTTLSSRAGGLDKGGSPSNPTYTMSIFKLPKGLCRDIASQTRPFWWGKKVIKGKYIVLVGENCVTKIYG